MAVTVSRDVTVLRRLRSVLLTIVIIFQSRVDGNVTNCRGGYMTSHVQTRIQHGTAAIARVTERLVAYGRLGFFLNPTACDVWTDVARRDQTHRVVTESNGCLKKFGIFFLRNYTDKKERVGRENRFATVGKFPFLLRPYRAHVQTSRPTTGANHSPYETRLFPTRPIFQQIRSVVETATVKLKKQHDASPKSDSEEQKTGNKKLTTNSRKLPSNQDNRQTHTLSARLTLCKKRELVTEEQTTRAVTLLRPAIATARPTSRSGRHRTAGKSFSTFFFPKLPARIRTTMAEIRTVTVFFSDLRVAPAYVFTRFFKVWQCQQLPWIRKFIVEIARK